MPEIVHFVVSGSLDDEFDLERVGTDIGSIAEFNPDRYPSMYLRFAKTPFYGNFAYAAF